LINFRFHIVSLTAVLLALGIGLVLGTTFLDTATVDVLEGQLTDLEGDLGDARARNEAQQGLLDSYVQENDGLQESLGARLFPGQLSEAPVLVMASRGVDEADVDKVRDALVQADAQLVGTWWLTDRLALDDQGEVDDLGAALELNTNDTDRLEANLARQLGDALFSATDPATEPTPATEPPLAGRLRENGFLEYETPEGAEDDLVRLPAENLRIVIVSGPGAGVRPSQVLVPLLFDFASEGPIPVVAVEPSLEPVEGEDAEAPESLVVTVREDEDLRQRVSTVDDLDRAAGTVATVLATVDADPASPVIGHYGLGDGTDLLPPAEEEG
jgi:hypothetical protein